MFKHTGFVGLQRGDEVENLLGRGSLAWPYLKKRTRSCLHVV